MYSGVFHKVCQDIIFKITIIRSLISTGYISTLSVLSYISAWCSTLTEQNIMGTPTISRKKQY